MSHKSYCPCAVYIMAGKRFRVPTLQEMEKADSEEALVTSRPLFRWDAASKSVDHSSDAKGPVSTPLQNTPPKRMFSQKALLSQQPLSRLSRRAKSTTVPRETTPSSSDKVENSARDSSSGRKGVSSNRPGDVLVSNSGKVDTGQRQAHQPNTSNRGKVDTGQRQAHQPNTSNRGKVDTGLRQAHQPNTSNSAQTVKPVETIGSGTAQPQAAARGSSEQATEAQDAIRADVLPTLAKLGKTSSLVVNSKQRGNPILNYVRSVPWEYGNIVPDYVMGQCNCALYLSLRYHQLHPDYIHHRLRLLGRSFDLRVLLVQVDIKDPHHLLKDLAKICILADCTLMVAFSAEEAGRYLETYKVYENKAAEAIMERTDSNFNVQLSDCLTRVRSVNKTDCATLLATFGNLQGIMGASSEDLALCPGFGPQKAKRLHDVFREPFLVSKKQRADTGK